MRDDERAALMAAIEPSVGPATRNYILHWAERIHANARLLESALEGDVRLTGFDMDANEPHWEIIGGPPGLFDWLATKGA